MTPSGMDNGAVNSVPNDGMIRYLGILNSERLLITSPKALNEVLTTKSYEFIKPAQIAQGIGQLLGVGVLLAEGEEHKFQRKHLMPAFAFRHIKDLYPVFWAKSKEAALAMTEDIKANAGKPKELDAEKGPIAADQAIMEAGSWASRATLDIIGVAGMGQDFGAIADPATPLFKTYNRIFKPSKQAQILQLLGIFVPIWIVRRLPVKRNGELEAAVKVIRSTCAQLIASKKEKLAKKALTDVDILSVAIESGGFKDENLIDQVMTFLAAGHETTASAMTWAIYMLCLHPEIQTKLRTEIRSKLPSVDSDESVSSPDIDRMPYLNAVCNEVLRYFAPVPLTVREAVVDTSILGHVVPKGTRIMLVPSATNKDTSLWGDDAGTFNPDRWMPDISTSPHVRNGGAASNYAFMTFLHGPRSCIGQGFSKAEFACLLAAWIGRLEFELNDPAEMDQSKLRIKSGVTQRPADGLWVKARVLPGW
ncbi:MAG: hypothetical protein M1818_000988 [Claussenomyces sp. TS43310]|nr:MAG: hypothetical protein M1818_000988 [Claussenomyces sp. TS43310]